MSPAFDALSTLEGDMDGQETNGAHDPAMVAQLAVSIQLERAHLAEALTARDAVVQRLANAYVSIRQKADTIERLHNEKRQLIKLLNCKNNIETRDFGYVSAGQINASEDSTRLEETIQVLHEEIQLLKNMKIESSEDEAPPRYEVGTSLDTQVTVSTPGSVMSPPSPLASRQPVTSPEPRSYYQYAISSNDSQKRIIQEANELDFRIIPSSSSQETIQARYAILAALPLPSEIPEDVLKPIAIPPSFTFQEFLTNANIIVKNLVPNYRIFQESTTTWCPDREEHGYFLSPLYKCHTNPRVATAHNWKLADPVSKMAKPTECFYNKDGKWYYAGVYKALYLPDLTIEEWENLSNETSQALVKETLAARKNTSPANIYETCQLYAVGALGIACVGVQCVGFNNALYRAILEYGQKSAQSGRLKSGAAWSLAPGVLWNSAANTGIHPSAAGSDSSFRSPNNRIGFTFGENTDENEDQSFNAHV
ncbi:hypothetical protein NEOLEDRAFT_115067 [Neolentinus lepideus HHB14362 ss-1]|uniref:DUF6697 domain-containing protein n=1 Tax=Neolentinus lepideus HHB14362 ss-1 TaxID=1314782 RepID=A0A165MVG0_9AGAM|nr:hypothetical protein NEOLEDRAFT_115067 [Neolentinus lepideus HHB14362 ss-1]